MGFTNKLMFATIPGDVWKVGACVNCWLSQHPAHTEALCAPHAIPTVSLVGHAACVWMWQVLIGTRLQQRTLSRPRAAAAGSHPKAGNGYEGQPSTTAQCLWRPHKATQKSLHPSTLGTQIASLFVDVFLSSYSCLNAIGVVLVD